MHRARASALWWCFMLVVPLSASADDPAAIQARIESAQSPDRGGLDGFTLAEVMERFGVPGVGIAVIYDFEIHWAKAYGVADVVSDRPVTTSTLFQAASISKPVAAAAVLRAVETGAFSLDDDINEVVTSWTLPGDGFTSSSPVTPRSLLSHTSGLGDGFGFPGYEPGAPLPTTVEILDGDQPSNVGPVRMERPPFTAFKYSGGGVTLMELALVDALGKPFPQILQELVLGPIGMSESGYDQPLPATRAAAAARAHDRSGNARDAKWHVYPELEAAGLWTTPTDLAKFAIEIQRALRGDDGRVIPRSSAVEMVTPVGVGSYGAGFSIAKRGEGWYFGHGGSNWGFRADLTAHKLKGYGVAIMTNADNGSLVIRELRERIERAYGWDSLDKPVPR